MHRSRAWYKSHSKLMPMQIGDVSQTWADVSLLDQLTGFSPNTDIRDGIKSFINGTRSIIMSDIKTHTF